MPSGNDWQAMSGIEKQLSWSWVVSTVNVNVSTSLSSNYPSFPIVLAKIDQTILSGKCANFLIDKKDEPSDKEILNFTHRAEMVHSVYSCFLECCPNLGIIGRNIWAI